MTEEPHTERDHSFDLAGFPGPLQIAVCGGLIRIGNGKKNTAIPEEQLLRIEHRPGSWRFGSSGSCLWLRFVYRNGRKLRKAEIALSTDDLRAREFLEYLKNRFPGQSCVGANEDEKDRVLSSRWRGVYGLHALHILTPAGIVTWLLLVCALILSIILAESMPARAVSEQALLKALFVFLGLALIPAALMTLVAAKALMTLRTDHRGLTLRRVFVSTRFSWEAVTIGEPRSDAFNVYTGLFCYYSERVNVVSSRSLVEIPLLHGGKTKTALRMNLEEAGPFFRELYYRGKVTLETAKKVGAFV
ncbi:MAG: hypothetical protein A4E73_04019 [Syntrophaceae bacterium PtaU1.Bin231]|nr:MAG: hypothetical protein A4E73_04019 [Syntrophaceae bacterium PtaU1.Bin231]